MAQKQRQEQILQILKTQGFVTVRYLTEKLQYSTATVNRDLNALQLAGLVKRSYGGVEAAQQSHLPPFVQRQFYHKKEKRRIAEVAVQQIREGDTVFLGASTTVQYMVPFLSQRRNIRIITNSLRIAMELGETELEVICLGGRVIERPYNLSGEDTVANALRYFPDKAFFSTSQVTEGGQIHGSNALYHVMLHNCRQVWFLTDRTKLTDRVGTALCDFSALTGVISDFPFPAETQARYPEVTFLSL